MTGERLPDGSENLLSQFESRARPNHRLRIAFGIDNAFTSTDQPYVKQFVERAKSHANVPSADWIDLSQKIGDAAGSWLQDGKLIHSPNPRIKLTSLIQALSLRVVLLTFFGLGSEVLGDGANGDLINLAGAINWAWMASKEEHTMPRFEDNVYLQKCLFAILPDQDMHNPKGNPLNFILPGFETMWRVVLRLFLEVQFADNEHRDILIHFAETPTKTQFQQLDGNRRVCAEFLVNEALRLYPPTRRIYRAFQLRTDAEPLVVAADVESCHTDAEIWGHDATVFNPERWTRLTSEQRNAFFPFGSAPFVCPAKPVFGPRVIGLLVGVLHGEIGWKWKVHSDDEAMMEHLRSRQRLKNERDTYEDVYLVGQSGWIE
ncbi:hypothetical protein AWENTII_011053 [Aspergillus wentii]|nr:hypothetical protein MW887_003575 [Aspergillus wentii]